MRTAVVLLLAVAIANAQTAPESKILSYKQYASIQHNTPYVLEFQSGAGALLLFGAHHTGDPKDPQIAEIEKQWGEFKPAIAYNEGGNPPTLNDRTAAIQTYGEPGFVRYLAARDQVRVATFEPSFEDEVAFAENRYTPVQVKLFYVLRQVTEKRLLHNGKTVEEQMPGWLSWPELTGSPRNLDEFVSSCRKEFPDLKDWHDVPADWFDPAQGGHYTNELANDTGMFRDQYIYKLLLQHVRQGERVFAVIGASHVVVQEPAWRETFGTPILYMNGPSK